MKVIFEDKEDDVIKFEDIDLNANYIIGINESCDIFTVNIYGNVVRILEGVAWTGFDKTFALACKELYVFNHSCDVKEKLIELLKETL